MERAGAIKYDTSHILTRRFVQQRREECGPRSRAIVVLMQEQKRHLKRTQKKNIRLIQTFPSKMNLRVEYFCTFEKTADLIS